MADYTTLVNMKSRLAITSSNSADDTRISALITAASGYIDGVLSFDLVASSGTKTFNAPDGWDRVLWFGPFYATTITSVTDAGGSVIPSTEWFTVPANMTPITGIQLKRSSVYSWMGTGAYGDNAISVVGTWGWAASCPADIREACEMLVQVVYQHAKGMVMADAAKVTDENGYSPEKILANYKRVM